MIYAFLTIRKKCYYLVLLGLVSVQWTQAMVFDNRYIPLESWNYITVDDRPSHCATSLFAATASDAYGCRDDLIGIPEIYGNLDLGVLTNAMDQAAIPLSPDLFGLIDQRIPWRSSGRIQAQGLSLRYHQALGDYFAIGFSWVCMRSISRQEFFLDTENRNYGTDYSEADLDDYLREAFTQLGFTQGYAHQVGSGDFDAYLRIGKRWDYFLKFRAIDAGLRCGMLAPAGVTKNPCNPASIPFGGNGFWGIYAAFDGEFELKEDMKVGALLRVNKRFGRTQQRRLPVDREPQPFGVVQGNVHINPGPTLIFSPYASLEGLRGGLGLRVNYTLTKHQKDSWSDRRSDAQRSAVPVCLTAAERDSDWGSDYFAVNVFYDFGKDKEERSFEPILMFRWDVPANMLVTRRSAKTNKVSFGVEFSF